MMNSPTYALCLKNHTDCQLTDFLGDYATVERYMYWNQIMNEGNRNDYWWDMIVVPENLVEGIRHSNMADAITCYTAPPKGSLVDALFMFAPRLWPGPIRGIMVSDILRAIRRLKEAPGPGNYLVVAKPSSLSMLMLGTALLPDSQQIAEVRSYYEYYESLIEKEGHTSVAFVELASPKKLKGTFYGLSPEGGLKILADEKASLSTNLSV